MHYICDHHTTVLVIITCFLVEQNWHKLVECEVVKGNCNVSSQHQLTSLAI